MINDYVKVSTSSNRHVEAILAAILIIVNPTLPIYEHGRKFYKSNAYMKFGRVQSAKLTGAGQYVRHLGYPLSDKTQI